MCMACLRRFTRRHAETTASSHGVQTPAFYWKVVRSGHPTSGGSGSLIAWLLPNRDVKRAELDAFIVSVAEIEARTGVDFTSLTEEEKQLSPAKSWALPPGCDKS